MDIFQIQLLSKMNTVAVISPSKNANVIQVPLKLIISLTLYSQIYVTPVNLEVTSTDIFLVFNT